MSSASHVVYVSTFKTPAATKCEPYEVALDQLADMILTAKAKTKDRLPWLKLAIFGGQTTEKGSLRHDANLLEITGIELDYDGEEIAFADAVAKINEIGLSCLVYTSPSHTPQRPRWRVLCPTSKSLQPQLRRPLVARLQGRMDGIFAGESFTLSQSYYYGRAEDNSEAAHTAQVLQGEFIDLHKDLPAFEAVGMPQPDRTTEFADAADEEGEEEESDDDDSARHFKGRFQHILESMGDGKTKDGKDLRGFNHPLIEATSIYAGAFESFPFDKEKLKRLLRIAIQLAPKRPTRKAEEIADYMSDRTLDTYIKSAVRKHHHTSNVNIMGFVANLAVGTFIYDSTGEEWSEKSVNERLHPVPLVDKDGMLLYRKNGKIKCVRASAWLRKHRKAEQRSWWPGQPKIIKDTLVTEDGRKTRHIGHDTYNYYSAPPMPKGDAGRAKFWVDHVHRIFPDEANMILDWLAHRYQKPGEKINFGLLFGGISGVGKDTILTPACEGLGSGNFHTITPRVMFTSSFTGYYRSVVLVVNEIHDVGDSDKYKFYEMMKQLCAAPPNTLYVNLKNRHEFWVPNLCGVVMTTNHREAIYLPEDDRRTYVCWSNLQISDFPEKYFDELWAWVHNGGLQDIWTYLRQRDISKFNAKAPPVRTEAHRQIISASTNPETEELGELVDRLEMDAITLRLAIEAVGNPEIAEWLADRKNGTRIKHRFNDIGFSKADNPHHKRGLWCIDGESQTVWVKDSIGSNLSNMDRKKLRAEVAQNLVDNIAAIRANIIKTSAAGRRFHTV